MVEEDFDDLHFADEDNAPAREQSDLQPWLVLVVDDEPEVHSVTRLTLGSVVYNSRPLRLESAYSSAEALAFLRATPHTAIVLLDVVMESDNAGLQLVHRVRRDLGNQQVRIILRTGQPGQAPERRVILDYDINDYKAKTELTSQKLFTATIAALRAFEYIHAIECHRMGLERIIQASPPVFRERAMGPFAACVLGQLETVTGAPVSAFLCLCEQGVPGRQDEPARILAARGDYAGTEGQDMESALPPELAARMHAVLRGAPAHGSSQSVSVPIPGARRRRIALHVESPAPLSDLQRRLLAVFTSEIGVGFDNVLLNDQLRLAQRATVVALADLSEFKDPDTGAHVLRVAQMSERIACRLHQLGHYDDQIDAFFLERIGMASILHDVGKVSTPDRILHKPGPLDPEERVIMREHAQHGGKILANAASLLEGASYLTLAAEVAYCHHEWWDGSGYPQGLKGEQIPLAARIVAVADVFDALCNKRPYKAPWPQGRAVDYIREQSGRQFDPLVVGVFLELIAEGGPAPAGETASSGGN